MLEFIVYEIYENNYTLRKIAKTDIYFLKIEKNYIMKILSLDLIEHYLSISLIQPSINYFDFHNEIIYIKIEKMKENQIYKIFYDNCAITELQIFKGIINTKITLNNENIFILEAGKIQIDVNGNKYVTNCKKIINLFHRFHKDLKIDVKFLSNSKYYLIANKIKSLDLVKYFLNEKYLIIDNCDLIRLDSGDKIKINDNIKNILYVLYGKLIDSNNNIYSKDSIVGEIEYLKEREIHLNLSVKNLSYIISIPVFLRKYLFMKYNCYSSNYFKNIFKQTFNKCKIITIYSKTKIYTYLKLVFEDSLFLNIGINFSFIDYQSFSCGEIRFLKYIDYLSRKYKFIFFIVHKPHRNVLDKISNVSDFLLLDFDNENLPLFNGKIIKIINNKNINNNDIDKNNKAIFIKEYKNYKQRFGVLKSNKFSLKKDKIFYINLENNHMKEIRKLKRILCNKRIGLVLGGGAARAIAHVGVIQALEENGIEIDCIGGTSMGAFIGGVYAIRGSLFDVYRCTKQLSKSLSTYWNVALDLTIPICSYFSGGKMNDELKKYLHQKNIEDLSLEFYCVSTDLIKMDYCVHTTGSLWKYIRVSMGVVEYLPPVTDKAKLLIDGAYSNNIPFNIMVGKTDTVISINVVNDYRCGIPEYGYSLGGIQILINRLFGKEQYLSYSEIQKRISYISNYEKINKLKKYKNVFMVNIDTKSKSFEFGRFKDIVKTGYDETNKILKEWNNKEIKNKIKERRKSL
ncbi:Leucine rich repeat protein [Spraguea lophii 42_110]|uniref:Leucine rich repeat protein n=1 Tax=Spraguea lophii (strain 42_110) TaxID=1358809 RepID=S7XJ15_SPRLO|nr:Leucine rich repeat protein [Spraguea lophii 42_110]